MGESYVLTEKLTLKNRWAIAILTSGGILTTFFLRYNISAVAPLVQKNLQLSDFELGLVLSSFLWVYTFLQPFAGWAADRFGAKLTLMLGVFFSAIVTLFTGLIGTFMMLILMRIILGIAQAPNFVTGAKVSASDWFNGTQRAKATSIWVLGGRLGTVISLPLAAWFAVSWGWQWAFFGTGLIALGWSVLWYFGYQNRPEVSSYHEHLPMEGSRIQRSLPIIFTPLGLGLTLASFGQGYIAYYLSTWLPTYLVRDQKFTILSAGVFSALPFISAAVTIVLGAGWLSDFLVKRGASPVNLRSRLFSIGMAIVSVMIFATAYAPDALLAIVFLTTAGAAWGLATPSLWTALVEATPKGLTGIMGGVQNFGGNLGGIVVTVLTGYLLALTGTFFSGLAVAGGMAMLGAISAAVLVKSRSSGYE